MPIQPGQTLSHYRLVEKIGEGGMGVVWKAVDTSLDREVAIKVLPEHFADDAQHLARFEREARLLATLNHRNIAAIYGLTQANGVRFLVMELVDGEDLARRLQREALGVDEAVDIAHQLARALEAAHDKGVLHRDLKPANIQITDEGRVKVLDFGLAKEFHTGGEQTHSPTLTSGGTQAGTILGTAAYMSPEQARGKTLDKRSDIWAFGCVFYECLTGRSAYQGETVSDTLAAILKSEPNWAALPDATPPRVRELLQRCLSKDLKNRLRDIGDARLELQRVVMGNDTLSDTSVTAIGVAPALREPRRFSWPWLGAMLLVGAVVGAGLWSALSPSSGSPGFGTNEVARFSVSYPNNFDPLPDAFLASPAGGAVAFFGTPRSDDPDVAVVQGYLRHFGDYVATPIPGTERQTWTTFSPDGRWLAVLAPESPQSSKQRLSKVPVDGSSPPLALIDWPDTWSAPLLWLPNGDILATAIDPLSIVRIPSDGSPPREPVEIRNEGFEGQFTLSTTHGTVLPDGVHVLGVATTYEDRGYDNSVAVLNIETGQARILIENSGTPHYLPSGHLLFTRNATLLAVPFDLERMAPDGAQVAITDGLRAQSVYADAWFDITPDGSLIHAPGGLVGGNRQLVLVDSDYEVIGPWSEDRRAFEGTLAVSSDGRRLAVTVVNAVGLYDIWVSDVELPRLSQLVHERGEDCTPQLWHPDGERLVYYCGTTEMRTLRMRGSEGTDEPVVLIKTDSGTEWYYANAFLDDGSKLIVTHWLGNEPELMLLPLEPGPDGVRTPKLLLDNARSAQVSPDGRWVAYISRASGREEVYLRSVDSQGSIGREVPVTRDGCGRTYWHRGKDAVSPQLRYACQGRVYGVTVTSTPGVRISKPEFLADDRDLLSKIRAIPLSILPDGRFIAGLQGDDEEPPGELNVVLNWFTELEQRLAAAN